MGERNDVNGGDNCLTIVVSFIKSPLKAKQFQFITNISIKLSFLRYMVSPEQYGFEICNNNINDLK